MKGLFLSPHNDDETLFGAFSILRHKPDVHVCFRSQVQEDRGGPTAAVRQTETSRALWWLGDPSFRQWNVSDALPEAQAEEELRLALTVVVGGTQWDKVWVPAYEHGGHVQHNLVSRVATDILGLDRLVFYATYRRGHMRTREIFEVPFEEAWVASKLRALSCYDSQHSAKLGTLPWFMDDTLREYASVAHPDHPDMKGSE